MVVGRVILFRLEESPKFLLNQNRPDEAAIVLHRIYRINHEVTRSENFDENIEALKSKYKQYESSDEEEQSSSDSESSTPLSLSHPRSNSGFQQYLDQLHPRQWRRNLNFAKKRLQPLLSPKYRLSTTLIWIIWGLVAFAYTSFNVFYPKFLQEHGEDGSQSLYVVYRDILIYSSAGVPGSVVMY
jgi:hypothetical protein